MYSNRGNRGSVIGAFKRVLCAVKVCGIHGNIIIIDSDLGIAVGIIFGNHINIAISGIVQHNDA